jgi:hypothetical protein
MENGMAGIHETAAAAARIASKGPGGHGGSALSMIGFGGWALEWKHGSAAVLEPFTGCRGIGEVFARMVGLDDATFLGLGLFVAIMIVSTASLMLGLRQLIRNWLTQTNVREPQQPEELRKERED